jgi:hypothetical protein
MFIDPSAHEPGRPQQINRLALRSRGKNPSIARRCDHGDKLSVRLQLQNSISLTVAMLPRIIA